MSAHDHVLFLHIPKAAGNTVRSVAYRNYPVSAVLSMPRHITMGIDAFRQLPPDKLKDIRFMRGHMMYGLHEHFPGTSTYMTFLRDPVERVVSLWRFIKGNPHHTLHQPVSSMSGIREFLESGLTPEMHNLQTVCLSGKAVASDDCDETDFLTAETNLRSHFSAVGIVEDFDRSLALCCAVFDWKNPVWSRLNVSKTHVKSSSLEDDELEAIRHHNQYDIRLYDLARGIFATQCETHKTTIADILNIESTRAFRTKLRRRILNMTDACRNNRIHQHSKKLLGLP